MLKNIFSNSKISVSQENNNNQNKQITLEEFKRNHLIDTDIIFFQ